jgi:hypothetical protein
MDANQHRTLSRLVWSERLRSWAIPALLGGTILAAFGVVAMNVPLSSHEELCDFQRLSYVAARYSWSRPVAYCDLKDGQTVMFRVPNGWVPPPAGSALAIVADELVFGINYRLALDQE